MNYSHKNKLINSLSRKSMEKWKNIYIKEN